MGDFILTNCLTAIFGLLGTLSLVESILSGVKGEKYTAKAIVAALALSAALVIAVVFGGSY